MQEGTAVGEEFAEIERELEQIAAGDLTVRLETASEQTAATAVANSLNDVFQELEGAMIEIQSFGTRVGKATEAVAARTSEIKRGSEQAGNAVEKIATSATQQTARLEDASGELTDLSATVEEISASSNTVASSSEEATTKAEDGTEQAQNAIARMHELETSAEETVTKIDQLESAVGEISEIVELIDEIAKQTNMLALNASIEAARAGEAGEGFAVVADEVKALAEETQDATQEIESVVGDVQSTTTATASEIREMRSTVSASTETVEDALVAFEAIADHIDELDTGIQSISDATDDQAETTQEIVSMVEEVTTLSQQNTEKAKAVSKTTTEQSDALGEIARRTDDLDELVATLGRSINSFTVGVDNDQIALTNAAYEAAVEHIERHNEALLTRSNDVVVAYTDQKDGEYTDEVNIAGRQRMLSQRIAKTTLVIARNERPGEVTDRLREAKASLESYVTEYDDALDTLESGGVHRGTALQPAPPGVLEELARTREIWTPFKRNARTIIETTQFNMEAIDAIQVDETAVNEQSKEIRR